MKPSQLTNALQCILAAQQPVFLWGAPGVGKSAIVRQVADEQGLALADVRAVLLDPVDLRGLPIADGNTARWLAPSFLPTSGNGILFLDELNAAPPAVQAACYQLVLDRAIGEYRLPSGWRIIAAGNREGDRAVTNRMPTPLRNRFVHLNLDVDQEDWTRWAIDAGVPVEVLAFIRFRPGLLHAFAPQSTEKAFPSPRSWEFVGRLMAAGIPAGIEFEMLSGTIGQAAAVEFCGFLKVFRQLPNPDQCLLDPDGAPVPKDPSALYALTAALARKATPGNADRFFAYVRRLGVEYQVLAIRDAQRRNPQVAQTAAFIAWSTRNAAALA